MQRVNLFDENFFLLPRLKNTLKKIAGYSVRGPQKVYVNLAKGLLELGMEVNLNKVSKSNTPCGVLSGKEVVGKLASLNINNIVVGPNLTAVDMFAVYKLYGKNIKAILAPSLEVKFVYENLGIPAQKIAIWPVGIDTKDFSDASQNTKIYDALVYFKRRKKHELNQVLELLRLEKQSYKILLYGNYSELEFKQALKNCRYSVVLDGTESQGIALQEIMSSNLPMFVFDQIYLGETSDIALRENLRVTSVPYWNDICGIRVPTDMYGRSKNLYFEILKTRPMFKEFLTKLSAFNPRKYVLDNLELTAKAKEFLDFLK